MAVDGQFCCINIGGWSVSGWIWVCSIFSPCHMIRVSNPVGTSDILLVHGRGHCSLWVTIHHKGV